MAVINSPWVGDARGKLGSGVYLRSKGQTLARSYNPSPLNRRTVVQQSQRSTFGAAVKFYSRGVQNLFNFAFEDKPSKESDYNAFMRYNAKIGPYFGKLQNEDDTYPAFAPWALSRGSLSSVQLYSVASGGYQVVFSDVADPGTAPSVADISRYFLAGVEDCRPGDIFTFLKITAFGAAGSDSEPYVQILPETPRWQLGQFVVDTNDYRPWSEIGGRSSWSGGSLSVWIGDVGVGSYPHGYAVVHSRLSGGKLLVSNTDLKLDEEASLIYEYSRSAEWCRIVMASWDAESKSILQGGLSGRDDDLVPGEVKLYFTLPAKLGDLDSKFLDIGGKVLANKIAGGNASRGLLFEQGEGPAMYIEQRGAYFYITDGADELGRVGIARFDGWTAVQIHSNLPAGSGPDVTAVRYVPW